MQEESSIENPEGLLASVLGRRKVRTYKVTRLTSAGENYGSLMLALELTLHNKEIINAVVKKIPPNEYIQQVFNTQVTFVNEINFYQNTVPIVHQFQKYHGMKDLVQYFPKCYGSRLEFMPNGKLADNTILVLENLKVEGFINLDRFKGFDLPCAELIVKDLAAFHAVPLALKMEFPSQFKTKIKPFLTSRDLTEILDKDVYNHLLDVMIELAEELKTCKLYLDRVKAALFNFQTSEPREPFATITHNDCWVNNTMIRFDASGKPVENKLVDFQMCDYASPAKDLIFFIFSSVQTDVCKRHYQDLVELYYKTFSHILQELKCDLKPFSMEAFQAELAYEAKHSQFFHLVQMYFPIFGERGIVPDIYEITLENLIQVGVPNTAHREKLEFLIKEFARRQWI